MLVRQLRAGDRCTINAGLIVPGRSETRTHPYTVSKRFECVSRHIPSDGDMTCYIQDTYLFTLSPPVLAGDYFSHMIANNQWWRNVGEATPLTFTDSGIRESDR